MEPTKLPNGNWTYTNKRGITTTGTEESIRQAYDLEIKASAPFATPSATPPVQQTTTSMRTAATENGVKLDEALTRIAGADTTKTEPSTVNVTRDQDNGDGTRTVTYSDGTSARVQATKNEDGTESYKELDAKQGVQYDLDRGLKEAKDRQTQRVTAANETLDSIKTKGTAATSALIDSIKKTYQARISLMEASNKRLLGAKEQAGLKSGRSKYLTELHKDVISDEEQQGLTRVADLEGKMLSLIAEAEVARSNKDLEIFNARMDELNDASDDMQTTVRDLQKLSFDKLKEMRDADKAESDMAKDALQMQLDKSERAAPALATAMAGLKTSQEKSAFVLEYSKRTGIPPEVLLGDIEKSAKEDEKKKLDIDNVRSQINTRETNTAIDVKKAEFNPTEDQKAKVQVYISKNGSSEDATRAKDDPDFFYYILGKAEEEEL